MTTHEAFAQYEAETGRKLAGLRADTREQLDRFLIYTPDWPRGVGRSSFILAAIELYNANPAIREGFHQAAERHEARLADECPWGQGV